MNINKLLKKRLVFFVTSTVFIVMVTIASSYAFSHSDLKSDAVVLNNNNLAVLYENGQIMDDKSSYPMSFQQGIEEAPNNTIKIINNKKFSTNFYLKITNKNEGMNNLSYDKIYYSINNSEPMLLSTSTDGNVYYGQVKGDEEVILNIKVWSALEYITNADQGKSVNLKFEIIEK